MVHVMESDSYCKMLFYYKIALHGMCFTLALFIGLITLIILLKYDFIVHNVYR